MTSQVMPRRGLLKYHINERDLEDPSTLLENMNPAVRDEFRKDIIAFMNEEEKLIAEGNKGKYALFYEGTCWRIAESEEKLIKDFLGEIGNHSCYCSKIGGEID